MRFNGPNARPTDILILTISSVRGTSFPLSLFNTNFFSSSSSTFTERIRPSSSVLFITKSSSSFSLATFDSLAPESAIAPASSLSGRILGISLRKNSVSCFAIQLRRPFASVALHGRKQSSYIFFSHVQ